VGHSKSFKMVPFESLGAVSYSPSIVISAPLTCHLRRALFIIGFALKVPLKWVLGAILGVGAKIFGGSPLRMQRPPIYAFSDIFGPDLTRRVVAYFCMGILP